MGRTLAAVVLLFGLSTAGLGCDPPVEARIVLVENLLRSHAGSEFHSIEDRLIAHGVPGVSIAVVWDGEIDWAKGYGTTSLGGGPPLDAAKLLQSGSISKPVAAFAALQLVEAGLLSLDQDVNETLTSWQVPENPFTQLSPVTVRRLLGHTAGTTVSGFVGYSPSVPIPTLTQILDGVAPANNVAIEVVQEPGSGFRYSGGGYVVLQQLIEDVTSMPMADVVRERLLLPAGMATATLEQPLPVWRHAEATSGHLFGTLAWGWNTHPELGAAGLWATPSDLARFAIALQRALAAAPGALLSQALAEEMVGMNLGIFRYGAGDAGVFFHAGQNLGYTSWMQASIGGGHGAVVMINSSLAGNPNLCEGECALMSEIMGSIAQVYGWPCAFWGVGAGSSCWD